MDVNALRGWGIAVSGGMLAVALAISLQAPRSREAEAQHVAGAAAPASSERELEFIVRFQGSGPIARAQARAARGDLASAGREVEAQLRRQREFAGLCFDRFTSGGIEIVLRTCRSVAAGDSNVVQRNWLARLRAMRGVAYADPNIAVSSEAAPG